MGDADSGSPAEPAKAEEEAAPPEEFKAEVEDPWRTHPIGTQMALLADDDVPIVISAEDESELAEGVAEATEALASATGSDRAVAVMVPDGGFGDLSALLPTTVSQQVISLDFSNNGAEELPASRKTFTWIRRLNLSGNPLAAPTFTGVSTLLTLDMSFCDSLAWDDLNLKPLTCLRRLNVDGCGLTTFARDDGESTPLSAVSPTLEHLQAGENDIEDLEALQVLAVLSRLLYLDLRENPCCEERQYEASVAKIAPRLLQLDNRVLKVGAQKSVDEICGIRARMMASDTVADQNEDRGSCSCLEGNACATPYTCKDWAHRYEIAKKVRDENMHHRPTGFGDDHRQ